MMMVLRTSSLAATSAFGGWLALRPEDERGADVQEPENEVRGPHVVLAEHRIRQIVVQQPGDEDRHERQRGTAEDCGKESEHQGPGRGGDGPRDLAARTADDL